MRPKVVFNSAMSLDGRVKQAGVEADFLSRLDKYRVHELRGSVDAMMVDVDTIILENPELEARMAEGKREPYRIIVDAKAEIREDARVLSGRGKKILVVSKEAPPRKLEKLGKLEGLEIITYGEFAVNLDELLDRLYDKGIRTLLLEGEGSLVKRMLNEGYVDELYVTVVPAIMGRGNELFEKQLDKEIKLDLEGILQYGDQVVLHYLVKR
ncbi:MAG: dihydrofolate reductase family protein [Candidatus Altiarchaeota archaeon]|nr:dihydrofolate reductase family protein [Candidatus Altiarchaeota archaeon]